MGGPRGRELWGPLISESDAPADSQQETWGSQFYSRRNQVLPTIMWA